MCCPLKGDNCVIQTDYNVYKNHTKYTYTYCSKILKKKKKINVNQILEIDKKMSKRFIFRFLSISKSNKIYMYH